MHQDTKSRVGLIEVYLVIFQEEKKQNTRDMKSKLLCIQLQHFQAPVFGANGPSQQSSRPGGPRQLFHKRSQSYVVRKCVNCEFSH